MIGAPLYVWTAPEGNFSVDEFKRLPLEGRRWELLDGVVVRMEDHGARTSIFTGSLLANLHGHVEKRQSGVILGPGCGFQLWPESETVRVTDISFTKMDRLPPRRLWNDYPRVAPDLIVEIFSPFERVNTVMDRITMFLQAGTREAWFIDSGKHTVSIFPSDKAPILLGESDTLAGRDVLPDFTIRVADLFVNALDEAMFETPPVTIEEFERTPLDGSWELIDGALIESSLAVEASSCVSATIVALVGQFVYERRLGRVYSAGCGFVLFPDRDTVRVPDVAFVSAERAPQGEARKHFPRLAPDLAVEVRSPTDRMADVVAKVAMYLHSGVQLIWLVDPDLKTVVVFRPDESPRTLGTNDALDGGEVLPGLPIPIHEIFRED
jgi:Uma2 family endonuclease